MTHETKLRYSFIFACNAGWLTESNPIAIRAAFDRGRTAQPDSRFISSVGKVLAAPCGQWDFTDSQWQTIQRVVDRYRVVDDAAIQNARVSLSPVKRDAVRKAIKDNAGWPDYSTLHGVNLAGLTKTKLFDAADALGVDVAAVLKAHDTKVKGGNADAREAATATFNNVGTGAGTVDWQRVRTIAREEAAQAIKPREVTRTIIFDNGVKRDLGDMQRHPQFDKLLASVTCRDFSGNRLSVYLFGPTGTGKTFAAKQIADLLGLPFHFHSTALEAYDLAGYEKVSGEMSLPPFVLAFRDGGVCLLDEMDRYDPKALTVINSALANGRMTLPNGTVVNRHTDFICIAAGNTNGHGATSDFTAAETLDKSTMSRFAIRLSWDVVPELEAAICAARAVNADVAAMWLKEVYAARAALDRLNLPASADQRCIEAGANLLAAGMSPADVRDLTYLAGLDSDQREAVINHTCGSFVSDAAIIRKEA